MFPYKRVKGSNFLNPCSQFYVEMKNAAAWTVVHYCSMKTLDSILDEGYLRAVDSRFMNDLGEYRHGLSILETHGLVSKDFSDIVPMTISFSTKTDSIPQWALYAKEIGIGIEFDFSCLKYWADPFDRESGKLYFYTDTPPTIAQECKDLYGTVADINTGKKYSIKAKARYIDTGIKYPISVVYCSNKTDNPDKLGLLRSAIENVTSPVNIDIFTPKKEEIIPLASTFIKETAFSYEYEARISTFAYSDDDPLLVKMQPKIQFHSNGSYLRPYVNLCFILEDINGEQINIGWPISTIWIGPGRNQEKAVESVVKRLEFGKVQAFPIPFDEFLERLKLYIKDLFDEAKCQGEATDIANNIISDLLVSDKKYEVIKGTAYHISIDRDNYKTAKEILLSARLKVLEKLKKIPFQNKDDDAENWLIKYEKTNYFSWYGIRVRASKKEFSFV